jgi:hypothetical protein
MGYHDALEVPYDWPYSVTDGVERQLGRPGIQSE